MYRTRHRVIATSSLSNPDGAVTMHKIYYAKDDREAIAVMEERGIDHFLICRAGRDYRDDPVDMRLYPRLRRGSAPGWLKKVPLPANLEEIYDLYRINVAK
jgi:hypothetical protein